MASLYRSMFSINSIHETTAFDHLRSQGLLPDDAWTEAIDDGHNIAFFSRDQDACRDITKKIKQEKYRQTVAKRRHYHEMTGDDNSDFIEGSFPYVSLPNRNIQFAGWERVA